MQITERDIEVMRFINDFGYCGMPEIQRRFGVKKALGYRLMRRLVREGYVCHKRLFFAGHGIYYLSAKGAKCTDLPAIDRISMGYYEHQMTLIQVYLCLREKYLDATWLSERRLKHEKFYDGVGKVGHVSDGILILPDEKKIAIEVELSLKGRIRIERIFKQYSTQFLIKEVWYFCPENMVKTLSGLAQKMPFIKIYNLVEFLA